MKKRMIAALLALALVLPLGVYALAEEDGAAQPQRAGDTATGSVADTAAQSTDGAAGSAQTATDAQSADTAAGSAAAAEEDTYAEATVSALSFAELGERVRKGNLTALMLQESIASIDETNLDKMYNDLVFQLDSLEWMKDMYKAAIPTSEVEAMMQSYIVQTLQSSYDSLEDTCEDLSTGKIKRQYQDAKRQLENARNQLVVGAESLYVATLDLQRTRDSLRRSLTALDRTVEEMELRYDLGQISALQLEQVKSGRTQLESSLETVKMNLTACKLQLQAMVGADLTGELALSEVADVSDLVRGMNYEGDLQMAREVSYDLYSARRELEKAKEDYNDVRSEYSANTYQRKSAEHTYQAAQYTCQAAEQSFELSFRKAYDTAQDYLQVLAAAQTALAVQQHTYESMELKYDQGSISRNALLDAADDLAEAEDTVVNARHNLFTAYRTYFWAVNYGVMNG